MHHAAIVRILAWMGVALAAICGVGGGVALVFAEGEAFGAFAITTLFIGVLCVSVLLLAPATQRQSRPRDGLGALILFWTLVPPLASLVFLLAVPGTTFALALEEATSCLTTTGHTVLPLEAGEWPVSLLVWRGLLHVYGALVTLTTVASIFAAINLGGPGVHRTVLFTIPEDSFFSALPRVVFAAAFALGGTILTLVLALSAAQAPFGVALADAVSVATTGLVVPGRDTTGPHSDAQGVILFIGLLFSTVGLAVALEIRAGRWRYALRDPEWVMLLIIIAVMVALAVALGERLVDGAGWAIAGLSTSGLPVNASGIESRIPLVVALAPVIIGGSALSTAGGVKLARIFVLSARAVQEFRTLAFRKAVGVFAFRGRVQPEKAIIAVWVYLVGYTVTIALALFLFTLGGLGFSDATSSAVGTLSNAGHLVTVGEARNSWLSVVASLVMVLGRLEVLAAVPALLPSFWRR